MYMEIYGFLLMFFFFLFWEVRGVVFFVLFFGSGVFFITVIFSALNVFKVGRLNSSLHNQEERFEDPIKFA